MKRPNAIPSPLECEILLLLYRIPEPAESRTWVEKRLGTSFGACNKPLNRLWELGAIETARNGTRVRIRLTEDGESMAEHLYSIHKASQRIVTGRTAS